MLGQATLHLCGLFQKCFIYPTFRTGFSPLSRKAEMEPSSRPRIEWLDTAKACGMFLIFCDCYLPQLVGRPRV